MRKLVFGAAGAVCLGLATPAMADGMYEGSMKDAPAPMPPVHIWAGLYVGGTVGFGTGDTSGKLDIDVERREGYDDDNGGHSHFMSMAPAYVDEPVYIMEEMKSRPKEDNSNGDGLISAIENLLAEEYDVDGAVYGAFIGYNWQRNNIVYGIEAGLNGTDFDGHTDCGFIGLADCSRELSYYGTVVGRLGYAVNNFLFYGFGGVAWGEVETDVSIAGFDIDALSEDTSHVGWTAGVGLETALTQNFIVGIEYAHVDLGEEDYSVYSGGFGKYSIDIDNKVDMDFDVIKFRAAYKFGARHEPIESFK
jgi:outer membrane immunogenic protein